VTGQTPIYLDAASATPLHPSARDALLDALDSFGDPRAGHALGRAARARLETARSAVAERIGAQPDEIVFTSGGTEANALAVFGTVRAAAEGSRTSRRRGRVVIGTLEHPSVLEAARLTGLEVVEVGCDDTGALDVDRFAAEVAAPGTVLACVQHASHVVGTIQPVAECAALAREFGVSLHTDARQTVPVLPVDVHALGVDLLSISSRTAYGPAGVGALYVRRGLELQPLIPGERGERRLRAGLPNLPGIAGLAAALMAVAPSLPDVAERLWRLTDRLRRGLAEASPDAGIRVLGHPTRRVPHLLGWTADGVDAETLLMTLEDRGLLAATVPNAQLVRAGLAEPAEVVVRFGLLHDASEAEVDRTLAVVAPAVRDLRTIAARTEADFAARHGPDEPAPDAPGPPPSDRQAT
jgi:cysteine desulfurase